MGVYRPNSFKQDIVFKVYTYLFQNDTWTLEQHIVDWTERRDNEDFGGAVALDGEYLVVGTTRQYEEGQFRPGAAHLFRHNGTQWLPYAILRPTDREMADYLGNSVALLGTVGLACAPTQGDPNEGVVYTFCPPDISLQASPRKPKPGATLDLISRFGLSGTLGLLALVDIDGDPRFKPVSFGVFDDQRVWTLGVTVPPGLTDLTIKFATYAILENNRLVKSNLEPVFFK